MLAELYPPFDVTGQTTMFRILHLSDLHIRTNSTWSTTPILSDAKRIILEQANEDNVDVVAFTGDIAFSGKEAEYKIAAQWLEDLALSQNGLNIDAKALLLVPGNHDVDRDAIPPPATAIENTLKTATEQTHIATHYLDADSFALLNRRHTAYFHFCQEITGLDDFATFGWSRVFEFSDSGKRIRFDGFNSSWLCRGDDDPRRLLIGQPQLSNGLTSRAEADITVALMHHPVSELMEFDERNTVEHLRQHHDMLLRGHLHKPDTVDMVSNSGSYLEICAGTLYDGHEKPNRFSIIDITAELESVRIRTFVWQGGRWILDRNLYATSDGIGEFPLHRASQARKPARTHPQDVSRQAITDLALPVAPQERLEKGKGRADASKEHLAGFPRFQRTANRQDNSIRQASISEAMLAAASTREIRVRKDAGSKYEGFLACVVSEFRKKHRNIEVFYLTCVGVNSGRDLQDALAVSAQLSVTQFGLAIRDLGPSVLILDDLDQSPSDEQHEGPSTEETVQALLDFCNDLVVIRVSGLPLDSDSVIRIGALDLPDTREYLYNAERAPTFSSSVDIARILRVTGGLPVHLDALIDALAVTNLESALAQIDSETNVVPEALPEIVTHEIDSLKNSNEQEFKRIRSLLWMLSILERGESLDTIKRLDGRNPIWPKHASYLQKKGCLDVLESQPTRYGAKPSADPRSGEKILRVPRMVRDYVISVMLPDERIELLRSAAALYFGSDWRQGSVRMRRRIAFTNEISTHQSGNEMTVLRALSSNNEQLFPKGGATPYALALSYISQLKGKGFYGEAYECSREFLGIASSGACVPSDEELQHLQILAGQCARMIGERHACVEFLSDALPSIRASRNKGVLSDVLVSLALALKTIGKIDHAMKLAKEILEITPKESSDYFQAKAILAETTENDMPRKEVLRQLATRARNLKHHTVADNIVIDLATDSDNTEEKLRLLTEVRSRGECEYNYVRATIHRVETLLNANRVREITEMDLKDLWQSYSLAYSQRLSGIFDLCHSVCWRYLHETGRRSDQAELFMMSSFVWRLNGNSESEKNYLEMLAPERQEFVGATGRLARLISYCKSRLNALIETGNLQS